MKAMEEKILKEGKVLPGGVLKVGSFLNQQIDTAFLADMAKEIAALYKDCGANKVLTIESSGIAIATAVRIACRLSVILITFFACAGFIPACISSSMASGSSCLGLSDVRITLSLWRAASCAMSGRFPLSRFPPHPHTVMILPFPICLQPVCSILVYLLIPLEIDHFSFLDHEALQKAEF